MLGIIGTVWGLGGVVALLVYAVIRLAGVSASALAFELSALQWVVLIGNSLFMAYAEGWRGFHQAYSPRVVARAFHLRLEPRPLWLLLAPLFCMGYFHATRRRLLSTYLLTVGILLCIAVFQSLSQPWRGILDAGVVVGLAWGLASIGVFTFRRLAGSGHDFAADFPADAAGPGP